MFTMILSVCWVISSVLTMTMKAVMMRLTTNDVDMTLAKAIDMRRQARMGNKIFYVLTLVGLATGALLVYLGFLKAWVLVIDVVFAIIAAIMNVLYIGYFDKYVQARMGKGTNVKVDLTKSA